MAIREYYDDVYRDTSLSPPNVYAGDGQGCGTVWFKSVPQARKVIRGLGQVPKGRDAGLCQECGCHYSFGTKGYKKYPHFACQEWKKIIANL